MVMKCFVACCSAGYASNKVKVTKFRAPKDEKQFILWQKAIPRTDRKLTKKDYVCENHFEEKYLTKVKTILDQEFPLKIWKLAAEAIPTLNLWSATDKDKKKKKEGKQESDADQGQNELDLPNTPQPIRLTDSHETLEFPSTTELAADVEMVDPLEIVDQPIKEAVNNIISHPTQLKLPKAWQWCSSVNEDLQEDNPIAYSRITAVRFGVVNEFTIPIKMITVVGGEVFYTVKGVLMTPPHFLPKSFSTVEELNDLLSRFDSANICSGFKLVGKGALTPNLKKTTVKQLGERRSKFCIRLIQKGFTCYRCEHLTNLVAGKSPKPTNMERLLEQIKNSTYKNRLLTKQLERKGMLIKELRQEIKSLKKDRDVVNACVSHST